MAFVKLDCGILNSTLWVEREPRDIFITALLMASPCEIKEPMPQYKVSALEETGFVVQPGWYGFVQAAGPGIVRMAMADQAAGMAALEKLGSPDPESRSSDFEGRRLVRVDGGYVVLNYMKYRDKDNTAAVRAARYRARKAESAAASSQRDSDTITRDSSRRVTKAEAEAEAEENTRAKILRKADVVSAGVDPKVAEDWLAIRKAKKAVLTGTAWKAIERESKKAGLSIAEAIRISAERGWQGFKADWVQSRKGDASENIFAGSH